MNFFKKPIVISFIVIALVLAGYFYFTREKESNYEFVIAGRGEIVQEVSVTGRIKSAEDVKLAFEKNGKVSNIYVKVGDKTITGQVLARLDSSELYAQLAQAQADLKTQEAKLDELNRGTREEEIKVQEVKVENAKISLEEAKKNLINKIQDGYTKSDDAVRDKIDQFLKSPAIPITQIIFSITDSQSGTDIEWQRLVIEHTLKVWKSSLDKLNLLSDLNSYLNTAKNNLNKIKSFLDVTALAVNSLTVSSNLSQATIDSWRADISMARTNINTALSNLVAAEEKLKIAEANLLLEQQHLSLKKAGATAEEIKAQEAQVEKAQAIILTYEAQIAKTVIRSPISGIVTKQTAKIGEIISANNPVVYIINESNFEIEANVPEADIVKIRIGNSAKITLDAYGEEIVFGAKIIDIEPAETIIEGIATYKTTFQFDQEDGRIKPGMTANIDILTARIENVIKIPQRAVITKGGEKIVRILNPLQEISEVKIKSGLRGSDGSIEIIEGIKEGDRVITFIKE